MLLPKAVFAFTVAFEAPGRNIPSSKPLTTQFLIVTPERFVETPMPVA